MKGKGLASKVLGVIPKILNIGKEGKKNPKWDYKLKKNPDEKHTVIIRDGVSYNSAFAGPSTHVYENITNLIDKYGSISEVLANADDWSPDPAIDLAGMLHDVQYAIAGQEYIDSNTTKSKARVEGADKRFLRDLMKAKSFLNALGPGALIKAKADVLPYSSFIEKTKPLKPKEIELYNKVLKEFGIDNPYFAPILKKAPITPDNTPLPETQRVGDENNDPNAFTTGGACKDRPLRRIVGKRNQCLHVYASGKSKNEQCPRTSLFDLCSAHARIRHPKK